MTIYPDTITPDTIDQLLAFHRSVFGDARMDDEEETGGTNDGASGGEGEETGNEAGEAGESEEKKKAAAKKTKLTPEQLEAEVARVRAEAANYRTKLRDAEKALTEAKTPEEHAKAVEELKAQNAALERQVLVGKVAREAGLPDELAARLQGATEEELKADAEALKKFAVPAEPKKTKTVELRGGLDPEKDPDDTDDPRVLARKYGGRRY